MGKYAPLCLKILACGSRSVDHDDVQVTDSKGSSDRRRWSFRKRSARHPVLTDAVGQEVPHSINKENDVAKSVSFQVGAGLEVTEKTPVVQLIEEKNAASNQHESKISDILVDEDDCAFDGASVIKVQASIRGFLARRLFLKEKSVTNLQAAVRGHLVRRQAVGALWCVQAIIRIQAHVRAQRARLLIDESNDSAKKANKEDELHSRCTCVSIEKLLSNAFANRLMESLPRAKCISIKCEPKLDSWKWLEIWTSVSAVSDEHQESGSAAIEKCGESPEDSGSIDGNVAASGGRSETAEVKPEFPGSADGSEDETNDIVYHAECFNIQSLKHVAPLPHHPGSDVTDSSPTEIKETDMNGIEAANSLSEEEAGSEGMKDEPEIMSTEQPNTEVKTFPGKASSPAFIDAQSKFEDLTSADTPLKSSSFTNYDQYYSATDLSIKSRDKALDDGVASSSLASRIGDSECGIEFSISSTLDSSDGSECGIIEIRPETGVPYVTNHVTVEEVELDPSYDESKELEESITPVIDSPLIGNTPTTNQKPSPENSPSSHMSQITVPESQATPSSQVSSGNSKKKSKEENSESQAKDRPMITEKIPQSNLDPDSASRNSMDHSQENKSRATRNSFGSAKHDHKDQELRDTSSTSTLPGYMQATKSARAKSNANGSPRSSPDVQDKDTFIKKRHSLPGSTERHVSPRVQRSLSQAQENAKGNNTQSPQDRKWRR